MWPSSGVLHVVAKLGLHAADALLSKHLFLNAGGVEGVLSDVCSLGEVGDAIILGLYHHVTMLRAHLGSWVFLGADVN